MTIPIRPAAAVRAVLAAVVLFSVGGCTGPGSAPAQADDAPPAATQTPPQARGPVEATAPPGSAAKDEIDLREFDTASLRATLADIRQLDLDRVRAGVQLVPQAQVGDLPDRLREIDRAGKRKRLFVKTMLPAVLRANEAIKADRDFLKALLTLDIPRSELPREMRQKLHALAEKYRVDPDNLDNLKRRVDVVPPALVLAQAAIETGWGTSRFAQEGNAIFGQHTSDPEVSGMVPQGLENPNFRVRTFETVTQAVEAYLNNLNTHPAYAKLRAIRAEARARGAYPDGEEMAAGLADYSARGWAYVEDIRVTIRANDLGAFAQARLRPTVDQLVDAGSFVDN